MKNPASSFLAVVMAAIGCAVFMAASLKPASIDASGAAPRTTAAAIASATAIGPT